MRLPDRQPVGCRQASRPWLSLHTRSPPFVLATPIPRESSLGRFRALVRRATVARPESRPSVCSARNDTLNLATKPSQINRQLRRCGEEKTRPLYAGQHPRSHRSPLECFDLRENSAAASRDLMQPGICGIAGTSCDDGVVVPEHLITAGVELVPHQAPFAKVDVDRDQVMKLVCQDDGTGPGRRFPEGGKVIALPVDPGPLPPLFVCLYLGTMGYQLGHDAAKPLLDICHSRRRVLDQIVQEPGNDHILIKTGSIQNPGHGDDMLYIRHTAASTNLALMTDRGEAQGLLEPGSHEWCERNQAEQSLEGPLRLAVSADRLAGLRKKRKRSSPPLGRIRQRGDILRMISDEDSGPAAMGPCGSRPRYQTAALTSWRWRRTWRTTSLAWVRKPMCPAPSTTSSRAPGIDSASSFCRDAGTIASFDAASTKVGTSICQSRSEMSKVSIWARRRAMTLWSVSQIRSTTKSARGPGSGLAPCRRMKN